MHTIGDAELWSYWKQQRKASRARNPDIRKGEGHRVTSYLELATKIAELQFMNRDHVLLYRGQASEHKNLAGHTSLKPTLFRSIPGTRGNIGPHELTSRFQNLSNAEQDLMRRYTLLGKDRIRKYRVLRWSILQHYEVCPTPLLDVTQSLRIAASFASLAARQAAPIHPEYRRVAYIYVLGVPNVSGAVTASAESGLQIIRLSSVCPPSALRPHVQEGYLLGEYPEIADYDQKRHYHSHEVDLGLRLVAKFVIDPVAFWTTDAQDFPMVEASALYPAKRSDRLHALMTELKNRFN